MNDYDSTKDTLLHIKRVNELLLSFSMELMKRAQKHDNSKLKSPEKELFDIYTPKLKDCTYGSDEYKQFLNELQPALENHYAKNSHHPEFYENSVDGMSLFDLVEMLVDWKAASERHNDGSILKSIEINQKRFNITDQLTSIFKNTIRDMNFLSIEE
jgi:hypothetical protein